MHKELKVVRSSTHVRPAQPPTAYAGPRQLPMLDLVSRGCSRRSEHTQVCQSELTLVWISLHARPVSISSCICRS